MEQFLTFRKMITPIIIQIIFLIGVVGCIIYGIVRLFTGSTGVVIGLLIIFAGPIFVRVFCEVVMVIFQILETLKEIAKK